MWRKRIPKVMASFHVVLCAPPYSDVRSSVGRVMRRLRNRVAH